MLTIFSAALCSCTIVLHNKLFKLSDVHILIDCYYLLWTQATPRLTEDTVKQCIDPRLKGECPPKGVAKVCLSSSLPSLLRTPSLTQSLAKKQLETYLNTECFIFRGMQLAAVAALCVQYESEFRPSMSIVVKALSPLLQQKPQAPPAAAPNTTTSDA